jgi:putative FmdB family regulatory protein
MPIYEYKCRECGDKFEKLVRSATLSPATIVEVRCPKCSSPKVERQVSLCGCVSGGLDSTTSSSCAPAGGG